ncbi:MAG: hypothetical protein ACK4VI_03095 [Alphaproteobacteria bacterium]
MQNMSEQSSIPKPLTHSETERELYSEKKLPFLEALECLYIHNNHSARHAFGERWSAAVDYIFDPKLLEFDRNGVQNDDEREQRRQLEDAADMKRIELLSIFQGMEQKLVVYGSLQVEALDEIMKQISRPIAEYIFSERFVSKYFPIADVNVPEEAENSDQIAADGSIATHEGGANDDAGASDLSAENSHSSTSEASPTQRPSYSEISSPPEVITENIGHVDHSYRASTPQYDLKNEDGETEEDLSWLNEVEEDEFSGIAPISVSEDIPKDSAPLESSAPTSENVQSEEAKAASSTIAEPLESSERSDTSDASDTLEQSATQTAEIHEEAAPPAPQPRVPSLDDLDKHVSETENPKPSEMLPSDITPRGGSDLPPIPGSEDSGEGEDIDSFFSKK